MLWIGCRRSVSLSWPLAAIRSSSAAIAQKDPRTLSEKLMCPVPPSCRSLSSSLSSEIDALILFVNDQYQEIICPSCLTVVAKMFLFEAASTRISFSSLLFKRYVAWLVPAAT